MQRKSNTDEYDLSEFGPQAQSEALDLSEFGPDRANKEKYPEKVNTFLGELPRKSLKIEVGGFIEPKDITEMINTAAGAPSGLNLLKGLASLSSKNVAKKVVAQKNLMKKMYSGHYDQLFNEARSRGLGNVDISNAGINDAFIVKKTTPTYHQSLKDFVASPTIENAQKAQSDLGKLINKYEAIDLSPVNSLTSSQRKVLKEAKDAQSKIRKQMFAGKNGQLNPDLVEKYKKINEGYQKDVLPYTKNKAIKQYQNKELSESKLIKSLMNNDKFMINRGHAHKEMKIRNGLKQAGLAALGGTALYEGYDLIKKLLGSK